MTRALILGRFQPCHKGHEHVFADAGQRFDELVVVIGSSQESHTLTNPFTASERYEMLHAVLRRRGIEHHVVPVPDIGRNALWVSHVEALVPRFDVLVSNNPLTQQLFAEAGYKVAPSSLFDRKTYSGTNVRKVIMEGGAWEALVPPEVAAVVEQVKGAERIRKLARIAEGFEGAP